jgi:tail lysozyme
MPINGVALGALAMGSVFLWSAIKGKSVLATTQSLITGKNPGTLPQTSPIADITNTTSGTTGTTSNGPIGTAGSNTHNLILIGKYLNSNGYSKAAAAGICGCIAGESGGNPESVGSGGNGLIGWTPARPGIVTGNPTKDLQTQLPMIIAYNNAQGAGLVAQLNAIKDPISAAKFYSERFERPAVKDSDVRTSMALLVYGAI